MLLTVAASASAQTRTSNPSTSDHAKVDLSLQRQLQAISREKMSRTPGEMKMDQALVFAVRTSKGENLRKDLPKLEIPSVVLPDGTVNVELVAKVTPTLLTQLQVMGGQIQGVYPRFDSISARLPVATLEATALLQGVMFVKTPDKSLTNVGSKQSQGDKSVRGDEARTRFGLTGAGNKVGVISDSNDSQETAQSSGDLPATIEVPNGNNGRTASGEGTGMMEIVYDVAPGSALAFNTANGGQSAFAQHYYDLFNAGCNVLTDDVFYFAEPAFQDGPIGKAINDIVKAGGIVFSAAGNEGNQRFKSNPQLDYSAVWEGDFASSGTNITYGTRTGQVHTFGSSVRNQILDVGTGYLTLQWNDLWGNPTSDYDLLIVDSTNNVISYSATANVGAGHTPYEQAFTNTASNRYALVTKFSGGNFVIRVNQIRGWMANTNGGQTWGHSASEYCIGTGAINAQTTTPRAFNSSDETTYYSSDGPRRVYYDDAGVQIAPNLTYAGAVARQQPVISAPDGVSTTWTGTGLFYGTSAAAPHAAGVTSLLREFAPDATPAMLKDALTQGAVDILTPGWDTYSGYGAVNTMGAIKVLMQTKTLGVSPATGVVGSSPVTFTLDLGRNAPPAGLTVNLTATGDTSLFTIPGSFTVAAGQHTGTFTVSSAAAGDGSVSLTLKEAYTNALLGTATATKQAFTGPSVASVTVNPTSVIGATKPVKGKVTLSAKPTSAYTVELSSNAPSVVTLPATVTVPANQMLVNFTITTAAVATDTTVTIKARRQGSSDAYTTQTLLVKAPLPNKLEIGAGSGYAGATPTGTITLTGPAPSGYTVNLASNNPTLLPVPASVAFTAGSKTATFSTTIGTADVTKTVTVTVSRGSTNYATGSYQIIVPEVSTVVLNPTSVKGGNSSTCTVTLVRAAPPGGVVAKIKLGGSSGGVGVPATVTIPAGAKKVTFTVTTSTVSAQKVATVTAKTSTVNVTANLTITP
ncbi:hypothetical protein BH11ARM2_BH11ARM2_24070 [soil metagenome]